jgi:hypothetical protein
MDALDAEGASAVLAPTVRVLMADGRRAQGQPEVTGLIADFLSRVRRMSHRVITEWQVDDVWIAELEATYELTDYFDTGTLPRVVIARVDGQGITELRVYGAHEHPLSEHSTGEEGMWVGGRWVPPL